MPQITSASTWNKKPSYCLNLGLTASGLRALGLSKAVMSLFPIAFLRGPAEGASALGDTGESAPEKWTLGGPDETDVDDEKRHVQERKSRDPEVWPIEDDVCDRRHGQ